MLLFGVVIQNFQKINNGLYGQTVQAVGLLSEDCLGNNSVDAEKILEE